MDVGTRIREHREAAGMRQDELAELCRVSRQTISNWERNKTPPDIESLKVMAHEFGTTIDALVGDDVPEIKRRADADARQLTALFLADTLCWLFLELGLAGSCWDLHPIFSTLLWSYLTFAVIGAWLVLIVVSWRLRKRLGLTNYYELLRYLGEHPARNGTRLTLLAEKTVGQSHVLLGMVFSLVVLQLIAYFGVVPLPVALVASIGSGAAYARGMRKTQREGGPVEVPLPPQR